MNTPIILINRDRITHTKALYEQLLQLGYTSIYILDMGSSYQPLLDWYTSNPELHIIYHQNTGHKALWNDGLLAQYFSQYEWVAISDSDIQLNEFTPKNFIEDLICIAKDFRVDKAGLAIEYKDITNQFLRSIIEPVEKEYWTRKLAHRTWECYAAPIDTTMCVVRPLQPFTYRAVRVADIMTCRHLPWYSTWQELDPEEHYFIAHCDLNVSTYAQHYLRYIKSK